ncbi:hypothetical protein AMJ87_09140 [candidate division WOR_3 bacterium SM23_60]|uniref:Uncharacterized protein n=1 Tax=candidate division WOR_3 bacterium SM23_60 TaxID=1703780 RepID=A0A0S8GDU1_UNCW3|nr:MAG: hypothetical protein AMJ87_09140 [candidate division WOR_3 bacterium SM23_60]
MNPSPDPWVWFAAFLTLCIFSFLYKDNLFYQFAEHLFVGISAGYLIAITWHNQIYPNLVVPLFFEGRILYVVPLAFGLFYFARFIPRVSFLVRIPIAFLLGWGSGVFIPAIFQRDILRQTQGTLLVREAFEKWDSGLWAVIILIGVICTLIYFFFSRERKGLIKPMANLGIIFLMLGFGASFGYTVMSRISLLIGRMQFLLGDWLGIIQ